MMKLSGKKKIVLTGISAIALTAGISGAFLLSSPQVSDEHAKALVLKDFRPGAKLSYAIRGDDASSPLLSGEARVDETGQASLPLPDDILGQAKKNLSYNLTVDNPAIENVRALDLLFNLDLENKNISLSGRGFENFTDIDIQSGAEKLTSKADWAGAFSQDIKTPQDALQLAFRTQNIASDAILGDNAKIEVFSLFGDDTYIGINDVRSRYGRALIYMAHQLANHLVVQTAIVGTFFDAKIQMEAQRKLQELKARAHKDYHPSDQMCRFGSMIKSVASAESKSKVDKIALNKTLMSLYLGTAGAPAQDGEASAATARVDAFKRYHCDPRDNNGNLDLMCNDVQLENLTNERREQLNKDVDYTRTIDSKLTLDIDFADYDPATSASVPDLTPDEIDVVAMAKHLYMPYVFARTDKDGVNNDLRAHYASRSYAAKMNVAHTSFINIMAMKAEAPEGRPTTPLASLPNLPPQMQINPATPNVRVPPITPKGLILTEDAGWSYMKALMREFGLADENGNLTTDDEIHALLGEFPSYYAQMEVLTKKIYQHQNFYTNLYDKPANVKRISASLDAIGLMHLRDRYDSQLRQEMLAAMLVEQGLDPHSERISSDIYNAMKNQQHLQ